MTLQCKQICIFWENICSDSQNKSIFKKEAGADRGWIFIRTEIAFDIITNFATLIISIRSGIIVQFKHSYSNFILLFIPQGLPIWAPFVKILWLYHCIQSQFTDQCPNPNLTNFTLILTLVLVTSFRDSFMESRPQLLKFTFMISGNFSFLMSYYSWCPETDNGKKALKMTLRILDAMNNGGIHDHVGQVGRWVHN